MSKYLALDIGQKHTGVAFYDDKTEIVMPLATIEHQKQSDLVRQIEQLVQERSITHLVLGDPLLLSGEAGAQSDIVHAVAQALSLPPSTALFWLDERYSNPRQSVNPHAEAACELLKTFIKKTVDK